MEELLRRADYPAGLPLVTVINQMPGKFEWLAKSSAKANRLT
jgi:hypothetical protein